MNKSKDDFCPVSVIMPVYNAERHLSESIMSILNQTFIDFELILIDDGSTDHSWDIIQTFSDERIILMRNEKHMGQYPTLNIGTGIAKGKYVAVADADHISLPDRLWKQYHYMENNLTVLASGAQFDCLDPEHKTENPVSCQDICAGLLARNCVLHSSLIIRADILKQSGGYNERYKYSSDYDLICRLSLIGKIENLPDTCIVCHRHPDEAKTLEQEENIYGIRQKYQIAFINKNKSSGLEEVGEAETGYSDMGQVIGLYVMGARFNASFRDKADLLLDAVFDNIDSSTPLCIKNGLLGFGMGLSYLIRNHFVEGDEDEVLESIDATVFYSILYFENDSGFDWAGTCYYLRKRALMPNRKNLLTQLRIKKAILHLLDLYKWYPDFRPVRVDKELDCYCEDNLFKHLISIYRKNETVQKEVFKQEKINSNSVTFVIPLHIDSEERRDNLLVIIEELLSIDNSEIIILEANKESGLEKQNFCNRVQYHFMKDEDPVYHRSRYRNKLLEMAKSAVVGIWDTDVLIAKAQIEESIRQIREGYAVMSFPYDGHFYDLSPSLSAEFRSNRSFHLFEEHADQLRLSFGTYSVGGAFLVNKDVYCRIGGENEHFYGWGAEDNERVKRVEILGYRIHRTAGALYHLYHPRTNSWYASLESETNNLRELIKVSEMSSEELAAYIKTWKG